MWLLADTTKGFFLEYWLFPEKKCVVSLQADVDLDTLETVCLIMRAMKLRPR